MASLNTLRTKGGWIISIVIGLALLAFILPEVFRGTGGRNPNKMKIGEIGGEMVSYTEYYNKSEVFNATMSAYYGKSNFTAEESDHIHDMAWNALEMEKGYYPGFGALGLAPLDAEQTDMAAGTYISPVLVQEFSNPQTGVFDRSILANFIGSLDLNPNGPLLWNYLKSQMNEQRALMKYVVLGAAGIYTTNMEVDAMVKAKADNYDVKIVAAPYSDIPDSLVKVTTADLHKYYDERKPAFREGASRDIEYVIFDILPSEDDYVQARKVVEEIAGEFAQSTTPVQYANLNTQGRQNNAFVSQDQIDPVIAAVIWDNPGLMYGPVFNNDVYTMARLGEVRMMPDSLGARHIVLPPNNVQLADSLVGAIRNGGNFAELAVKYSVDPTAAQNGGDLGRFVPGSMIPEFSDALLKQKVGDVFTVATPVGLHVVELTYTSPLVKKAQVAMIEYHIDPSSVTEMGVYNDVRNFYQAAYGSPDNFNKAVSDNKLQKRVDRVTSTQRNITGLGDSRELVRWAFNGKPGDVSTEMKIGLNQYVVAVLTAATEDGIAPFERYQNEIRAAVIRQKKGEMLAAKMTGNSIEEIAVAVNKPVVEGQGVNFMQMNVEGIAPELKLMGAITSGVPEGKLSKPVIGNFGVYSFVITGKTADPQADPAAEKAVLEATSEMYLDQRMMSAVREEANIVDMRVKYF